MYFQCYLFLYNYYHIEVTAKKFTLEQLVVCPVKPATAPNRFMPKRRVPSLVGHLTWVSYVCLVGQSLKEDDNDEDGTRGTPGAVQQISWHLPYD